MKANFTKFLKHAFSTTPYYNGLINDIEDEKIDYSELFANLKSVSKDNIQSDVKLFLSNAYCENELITSRTSGSTGKLLTIYWREEDMFKSLYPLWKLRYKRGGIFPHNRKLTFHSFIRTYDEILTPTYIESANTLSFSKLKLNNDDLFKQYERMMAFEPEWIQTAPYCLFVFTKFMVENNLEIPRVKLIELSGEHYNAFHREYIEKNFKIKSYNHYGCREANALAYECIQGNMHLVDNVIVEIDNPDFDGYGEVVISVPCNYAMPLLKYNLKDIGRIKSGTTCTCGSMDRIIEIKFSRVADIITVGTHIVYSSVFLAIVEKLNIGNMNCISQFRVIQFSAITFELQLSMHSTTEFENIKNQFMHEISLFGFDGVSWDIKLVDILTYESSEKFKYFVSYIK